MILMILGLSFLLRFNSHPIVLKQPTRPSPAFVLHGQLPSNTGAYFQPVGMNALENPNATINL